jgi:hypothetical protein
MYYIIATAIYHQLRNRKKAYYCLFSNSLFFFASSNTAIIRPKQAARVDEKDATLKMAKALIYQGVLRIQNVFKLK